MVKLFDFLANTGDGAIAIDANQRILYWNRTAEQLLGYSAQEAFGQRCYRFFAGRTPECSPLCCHQCDVVQQTRRLQPVNVFRVVVRHKDGRDLMLDVSTITVPPQSEQLEQTAIVHLFRVLGEAPPQTMRLRIYLLGAVQVRRADGTRLSGALWRQGKVRALLAYLATQRGNPVHRDVLIEALWPDVAESTARHNLHTAVYNLRRCLEPHLARTAESHYILLENHGYRLNGGIAHWIDTHAFETGIRHARRESDPHRALAAFQATVELYQDDFLSQLGATINWHWQEQERLRELYLQAMEAYGQLLAKLHQADAACLAFEAVMARDPCRESACVRLMQLRWQLGQRSAALTAYRRLVQALQEDLGVEPDTAVRQLHDRIAAAFPPD